MAEYPRRERFYAHRLTRLLFKSCAAQSVGHHAMLLIIHVAHTEDAKRYQGPVSFWNSQLSETLGFKSPKQLNVARSSAIESGWLHYERKHARAVGYYWTLIPRSAEAFDDAPIEDDTFLSDNGKHSASGTGSGMRSGTGTGTGSGTRSGKPSTRSRSRSLTHPEPDPDGRLRELMEEIPELKDLCGSVPRLAANDLHNAIFDRLTPQQLGNAGQMLNWFARQLSARRPATGESVAEFVLVLATARFVRSPRSRTENPVARFSKIVSSQSWNAVLAHVRSARQAYESLRSDGTWDRLFDTEAVA